MSCNSKIIANGHDSLSMIVRAHNCERELEARLMFLLELLAELSERFEILVVDDGSTDESEEIAWELSIQYPQIKLLRFNQPLGMEVVMRVGRQQATGDIVMGHDVGETLDESHIRRSWFARNLLRDMTPEWLPGLVEWCRNVEPSVGSTPAPQLKPHMADRLVNADK